MTDGIEAGEPATGVFAEGATPIARGRLGSAAVKAAWALGMLLLAAITIWSAYELLRFGRSAVSVHDLARFSWVGGSIAAFAALWGFFLWNRGPLRTHPLAVGLGVVLVARLIDVALVPAPLVSDFLRYNDLAIQISQHGPTFAPVPTGYSMVLGAVYAVFGAHPVLAQLLNCFIAVGTAALAYDMTKRLWGDKPARWALWLFALAPAQILMTGVLATEAPYGLLLMSALWLAVRFGSRRLAVAIAIGAVLATSNYVRATSPALIPAFAALPFLSVVRARTAIAWGAALVFAFLVVMTPVVAWNEQQQGTLSISPSNYAGWTLLVGTDPAHTGAYNVDLIALVGGTPGTPEFDRRAGQIALERLKAKPLQFVELAIKKFPRMWAIDDYGVTYTSSPAKTDAAAALLLISQAAYLAAVGLALFGLWRIRAAVPPAAVVIVLMLATLVVVHSFTEIEPRYHAYMVPFFCVLAGPGAAALRLPRRRAKPLPGAEA
jgi:hypothetical protein